MIERIEKITTKHKIIKQNIDTSKYVLNEEFKKDQTRQDDLIRDMQDKLKEKISSMLVEYKEQISLKDLDGKASSQFEHRIIGNPPTQKTDSSFTYLTRDDIGIRKNKVSNYKM